MSKLNLVVKIACLSAILFSGVVFAAEPGNTPVAELWCANLLMNQPPEVIADVSSMHSSLRDYAGQLEAELKLIKNGSKKKPRFFRWPFKSAVQRREQREVQRIRGMYGDVTRPNDLSSMVAPVMQVPEFEEAFKVMVEISLGRTAQLELDLRPQSGNETFGFEIRGAPAIAQYLSNLQAMVDGLRPSSARVPSRFTKGEVARNLVSLGVMSWFLYNGVVLLLPPYHAGFIDPTFGCLFFMAGAVRVQSVTSYFGSMCTARGRERYNRKRAATRDFRYVTNIEVQKLLAANSPPQNLRLVHEATTLPMPLIVRRAWMDAMARQEPLDWRKPEVEINRSQISEMFELVVCLTDQIFYFDSRSGEPVLLNFVRFKEKIRLGGPQGGVAQEVVQPSAVPFGFAAPVGAH